MREWDLEVLLGELELAEAREDDARGGARGGVAISDEGARGILEELLLADLHGEKSPLLGEG